MANVGGQFVNPAYASPEQVAQLRRLAASLMEKSVAPDATHWTGILAKALMGYSGRQQMEKANVEEQASNLALQKELARAIQSGDLSQIVGTSGHPRITPAMIALLLGTQELKGTEEYGPGARMAGPGPSLQQLYEQRRMGGVTPVTKGQPLNPADVSGEPARPGQENLGDVTGTKTENIPPGISPSDYIKRGYSDAGITPAIPPKLQQAMPTLDVLQQKGQQYKNIEDLNAKAVAANEQMKVAGMMAKPKMNTLSSLWNISESLNDSGWTPRLQKAFHDATGVMPPPNADKYELFDSLFKRLGPDAIQEAAASGRIPPALLQQYNERGPQIWQDKNTRAAIINSLAMPVDMHLRAAHIANQGGDPIKAQQRINSLEPYASPFTRRVPTSDDIQKLKQNPQYSTHFDAAFWPHTADEYIGQ